MKTFARPNARPNLDEHQTAVTTRFKRTKKSTHVINLDETGRAKIIGIVLL